MSSDTTPQDDVLAPEVDAAIDVIRERTGVADERHEEIIHLLHEAGLLHPACRRPGGEADIEKVAKAFANTEYGREVWDNGELYDDQRDGYREYANSTKGEKMNLKPGMRVKVEYETVVTDIRWGETIWIPGLGYRNTDGSESDKNNLIHERGNAVVTPLQEEYEVIARITVPAGSSEGWAQELRHRVDNALDRTGHQGLVVNVKKVSE